VFAQLVCIKTNRVEAEKIWVFYTLSSMWSTNAMQSKALHRALAISASIYRQNKYCQAYNYGYCQQFACPTRCHKLYLAINKSCVEIPFHLGDVFYLSRGCTPSGKWIILHVEELPKMYIILLLTMPTNLQLSLKHKYLWVSFAYSAILNSLFR